MAENDHDLLIRIDTKTTMIHDSFIEHVKEDAKNAEKIDTSLKAAHRRLDGMMISGVLALILIVVTFLFKISGKI